MRYENEPRPDIESHYHIRELIERQQKRADDRTSDRDRKKAYEERAHTIQDSPFFTLTDFWCVRCGKDFKAQAVKQIELDWSNLGQSIAFYKTKHWCGAWCIRLVTDKFKDGYWIRSRAVNKDRGSHFADMLQPGETGFSMLYRRKNKGNEITW